MAKNTTQKRSAKNALQSILTTKSESAKASLIYRHITVQDVKAVAKEVLSSEESANACLKAIGIR